MRQWIHQLQQAQINMFDLFAAVFILFGLFRGKRRGISHELLDLFQWLAIVVIAALFYRPLGDTIARVGGLSLLASCIAAYVLFAILIKMIFSGIKRLVGGKLINSDVFGNWEYLLGMMAGATRYLCMLVFALSLLNAKHISEEQRAHENRLQQENFGSIRFPTWSYLQEMVFVKSAFGRSVKNYLRDQLMTPISTDPPRPEGIAERRERLVDEATKLRKLP